MESVFLLLVMGAVNIFCFYVGASVGQKVSREETVDIPTLNPAEFIRNSEAKKELQKNQEYADTILRNIEAYDGTAAGQKDIPGR